MNFISEHKEEFPLTTMCHLLGVSRQGWRKSLNKEPGKREREQERLLAEIKRIHKESRETYGSERIAFELEKDGWGKCVNRVARLMAREGIRGKTNRKKAPRTTDSDHNEPAAPNLAKLLEPTMANQLWYTDITYIRTWEGFFYLAAVLDSVNRQVVGWYADESMHSDLVIAALKKAIANKKPGPGLVVHSDRGSQYASKPYRELLKDHGFCQSMSRKGNCYDNAKMESFFGTLKREEIDGWVFDNMRQGRLRIFSYIEGFYNPRRIHTSLGGLSPDQFDAQLSSRMQLPNLFCAIPSDEQFEPILGNGAKKHSLNAKYIL